MGEVRKSASNKFTHLRAFVAWGDELDQPLSLDTVEDAFRHWCDDLRSRVLLKVIKNNNAYNAASVVSSILDAVLETIPITDQDHSPPAP